jgi:lanthanide-dependent methanol dehydrogenase
VLTCDPITPRSFHHARTLAIIALLCVTGCGSLKESKSHTDQGRWPVKVEKFEPRPYTGKLEPDDGQWVRAAKDYASTRFSSLDQIDRQTVKQLKLAFTFDNGIQRGQEAAPLVVNRTMYLVSPWPNTVYALDLTKPNAPVKWRFDPQPAAEAKGVACCDWVNRGAAYAAGKIIFNTLDGNTVALDADSGKLLWKTKLADPQKGETMTMAPLVIKDKVLVGTSGGEFMLRPARSPGRPSAPARTQTFS